MVLHLLIVLKGLNSICWHSINTIFLLSCESFNGDVRAQNIYSNRLAPSRDIGKHFAVLQYARHIIDGGQYDGERYQLPIINEQRCIQLYRCGESLRRLCLTKHMQAYLCQTSIKELSAKDGIYQPGTPRMVRLNF